MIGLYRIVIVPLTSHFQGRNFGRLHVKLIYVLYPSREKNRSLAPNIFHVIARACLQFTSILFKIQIFSIIKYAGAC